MRSSSTSLTRISCCILPTAAALFAVACGTSSMPPLLLEGPEGRDAGAPIPTRDASLPPDDAASPDASPPPHDATVLPGNGDAGHDASIDSAPPPVDSGPEPTVDAGVVLPGANYYPLAITSDDLVVYGESSPTTPSLFAVPLAGGSPTLIDSQASIYWAESVGHDVLWWEVSPTSPDVGKLSIWSPARTAVLAATSLVGGTPTSADGSQVSITQNVTATQFDIAVVSNGGAPRVLLTGVQRAACVSWSRFAGAALVVQHCNTPVPDGGVPGAQPPTLTAFFDGGAPTDLATLTPAPPAYGLPWDVASDGSFVYAALQGTPPKATAIALPGGGQTAVDTEGEEGFVVPGTSSVVYRSGDTLRRTDTTSPAPVDLATAGSVSGLLGWSPDGSVVAYFHQAGTDARGHVVTDLAVSTTAASGSVAHQLVSTPTARLSAFTADAKYVIYASDVDATSGLVTLSAVPVTGGAPRTLGTSVLDWWAGADSKVVLADQCDYLDERCSIHALDLAAATVPTRVATNANASRTNAFVITRDAAGILFASNVGAAGLYVAPMP